jgi:hypothetical protein
MLRLMGLPHVARFPKALVARYDGSFQLLFHGEEDTRHVDVPIRYLNDAEVEAAEVWLVARLQELGYEVTWRSPTAN